MVILKPFDTKPDPFKTLYHTYLYVCTVNPRVTYRARGQYNNK
jgi:hypothetical protein